MYTKARGWSCICDLCAFVVSVDLWRRSGSNHKSSKDTKARARSFFCDLCAYVVCVGLVAALRGQPQKLKGHKGSWPDRAFVISVSLWYPSVLWRRSGSNPKAQRTQRHGLCNLCVFVVSADLVAARRLIAPVRNHSLVTVLNRPQCYNWRYPAVLSRHPIEPVVARELQRNKPSHRWFCFSFIMA